MNDLEWFKIVEKIRIKVEKELNASGQCKNCIGNDCDAHREGLYEEIRREDYPETV